MLAEQHDEWAEQRRYLGLDAIAAAQAVLAERITQAQQLEQTPDQPVIAGDLTE